MNNMSYTLDNMVPITLFNRGQAGKIFSEVKEGFSKVVIKNNEPEAILISPTEYKNLQEKAENLELIQLLMERKTDDSGIRYSQEEIMSELGLSDEDLVGWEDVEIE